MDVIIFGGQSNMQGESEKLSSTAIIKNSYEYKYLEDALIPLSNPVGEDITFDKTKGYCFEEGTSVREWCETHIAGSSCFGHTNLVPEFCRGYTEQTGKKVVAVHIARGSTRIEKWMPGTIGYSMIVEKSNKAMRKIELEDNVERVFFVWLQGESDAIAGNTKSYYKEQITALCKALRQDVGIEKFCMIRVGRFTNDERDFEIISAQDEVCEEDENFLMLTDIATKLNEEQKYMNPFVEGHYSAEGLEVLGYVAGNELGLFCNR